MTDESLEKILSVFMDRYLNMDYNLLPDVLGYEIKELVG